MEATQMLIDEHKAIKRVLRVLMQASRDLVHGKKYPPALFEQAVDFLRTFADQCHHMKEQDILFKEMEKVGIPVEGGPLGVMLQEHDLGRALVRGIAEAIPAYARGDTRAASAIADHARGFANLLNGHIDKEDNILYPMAEMHLDEKEMADILARFLAREREIGDGVHQRYHHVVAELETAVFGAAQEAPHVHQH